MRYLVLLSALLMVGCAKPETPQQAVYQATVGYNVAATVALKYVSLPRCPAATICSKKEVVDVVKKSDTAAYNAVKAAEGAVRSPAFSEGTVSAVVVSATSAVSAFSAIVTELGVK